MPVIGSGIALHGALEEAREVNDISPAMVKIITVASKIAAIKIAVGGWRPADAVGEAFTR